MHTKPLFILSLLFSVMFLLASCSGGSDCDACGTDGSGDDNPTLSIVGISDGYEGGPAAVFEVQLDQANSTGAPITGTVTLGGTGSGYATGADITATSTQYEIPVNERTTSISVGIEDDNDDEGTETLTAILDGTPAGINRGTDTASVFIIDNDEGTTPSETVAVTVSITAISPTITEGETASFSVYLEGGATATTTITGTVSFTVENTGLPRVSLLYRIGPGASFDTIRVPTFDDQIPGTQTRTLTATLDSASEGALGITTAEVQILDNEKPTPPAAVTVSITAVTPTVTEGDTASFRVYLEGGATATTIITGTVSFTAPGVPDDVTPTLTSYSISTGETSTLVITLILDDNSLENLETLTATLQPPAATTGVYLGTPTATTTIIDSNNAQNPVTASLSVLKHGNEAGSGSIEYRLTLAKANHTGGPITFTATLTGTATSPHDYNNPPLMVVSVADGASTAAFTVDVNNDDKPDENETLALTIGNPSHPAIIIVTDTATADILDSTSRGQFKLGTNVAGLEYETAGGKTGTTTATGYFTFEVGETVTFTFAGITLGTTIGKRIITPIDLVENGSIEANSLTFGEVRNIARFLFMLDKDGDRSNGVELSEGTRNLVLARQWYKGGIGTNYFPISLLWQLPEIVFTRAMTRAGGPMDQLQTISPPETHTLSTGIQVVETLNEHTRWCSYSGIYLGTFGDDDHGRIGIYTVRGAVHAIAYSDAFTQTYHIIHNTANSSLVSYDQNAEFSGPTDAAVGITLSGNFTSVNSVGGTWTNTTRTLNGDFIADRVGGNWDASERFVGMLTEGSTLSNVPADQRRGLFDLQLDANPTSPAPTVDGSLYWLDGVAGNWVRTPVHTPTSTYTGNAVTVHFADGTNFSGNLTIPNQLYSFLPKNTTWMTGSGTSGGVIPFAAHVCKLN